MQRLSLRCRRWPTIPTMNIIFRMTRETGRRVCVGGILSAFYKTRRRVAALRPDAFPVDNQWHEYIMTGDGNSYGAKAYLATDWKRLGIQLSYAYIRSWEWFSDYASLGRLPSLYDVPHAFAAALTYRFTERSSVSLGGEIRSGRVQDLDEDMEAIPEEQFRSFRDPLRYRLDAGYGYQKTFRNALLAFRVGLSVLSEIHL